MSAIGQESLHRLYESMIRLIKYNEHDLFWTKIKTINTSILMDNKYIIHQYI